MSMNTPIIQGDGLGAVVLRGGQAVVVAPQEVLQVGDRVMTAGQATDVLVPTASGTKSVLLRIAPNSEVAIRPLGVDGAPALADVVVVAGDAQFVDLPPDLGEQVSMMKNEKSSAIIAGDGLSLGQGLLLGGLGLAALSAIARNSDSTTSIIDRNGDPAGSSPALTDDNGSLTGLDPTVIVPIPGATGEDGSLGGAGADGATAGTGATGDTGDTGDTGA
ncbi:MAG: hypothetical protein ACJA2P_001974, partial [Rhodoferax sp.]